eukprot:6170325-Amphidinium_carterae.1
MAPLRPRWLTDRHRSRNLLPIHALQALRHPSESGSPDAMVPLTPVDQTPLLTTVGSPVMSEKVNNVACGGVNENSLPATNSS